MIDITAAWYCWAIILANVFVVGACVGQWGTIRILKRRERRRRDEAAQFEPGDRVTFGDRSYVVVRSAPAPRADHNSAQSAKTYESAPEPSKAEVSK